MSEIRRDRDYWRWPALGLWVVFFGVGLVPERIFYALRDLAEISTYDAALNSYQLITLGLTIYLAFFCYQRCRNAGLEGTIAQAKAIQIGALALLAFLDVPFAQLAETRSPYYKFLLGIASAKLAVWLYLLSITVRYYFWGGDKVFARMITLIPSAHLSENEQDKGETEQISESAAPPLPRGDGVNQSETKLGSSDDVSAHDEAM